MIDSSGLKGMTSITPSKPVTKGKQVTAKHDQSPHDGKHKRNQRENQQAKNERRVGVNIDERC